MNKTVFTIILIAILLGLPACLLGGNSTPLPTQDQSTIETAVAATVEAKNTPVSGGSPTSLPAISVPTIAPSVLQIVVVDPARNLWLYREGGSAALLASSGDVTEAHISQDGNFIAYVRSATSGFGYSIDVINPDGSNHRTLVSSADFNTFPHDPSTLGVGPYQVAWIPGTHTLAYNTRLFFEGPGLQLNNDLQTVNADTLAKSTLKPAGSGGTFIFSPDGQKYTVSTPTTISIYRLDGSAILSPAVTFPNVITYSEAAFYPSPVWSPDSTYLLVTIPPSDPMAAPLEPIAVWRMNTDGRSSTLVHTFNSTPFLMVYFSPDLNKVAYMLPSGAPSDNIRELHIANIDGSGDSAYVTAQSDFNNWSLDSAHFVYTDNSVKETKLGMLGSTSGYLADFPFVLDANWVNGTRIIYKVQNGSNWEVRYKDLSSPSIVVFSTATSSGSNLDYDFLK